MRVPRTLRTAALAVLPLLAAACMGSVLPTEIPPTPGASHADRVPARAGTAPATVGGASSGAASGSPASPVALR